jgi:hypothetical protein
MWMWQQSALMASLEGGIWGGAVDDVVPKFVGNCPLKEPWAVGLFYHVDAEESPF